MLKIIRKKAELAQQRSELAGKIHTATIRAVRQETRARETTQHTSGPESSDS
jgi:hypothetical protein